MPTALDYFVSYARRDRPAVDALMDLLRPRLKIASGPGFAEWNDRMIPIGAAWRTEIDAALTGCAFGLLLLSPEFFASDFIAANELPHFIEPLGPRTVVIHKPLVPVGLKPVPLDGSADLKGIQHVQVFRDDRGRWFSQTRGHVREAFADQLVAAMFAKLRGGLPRGAD